MGSAGQLVEHLDAIIIGADFSGIYLRKRGFTAKIYEATEGLGGVWYTNDYPGCRTDIEIPFSQLDIEEVWRDWTWKERYPTQPELQAYFRCIDQKLEISKDTYFGTRVDTANYDVDADEWVVRTSGGHVGRAKFLLRATLQLHTFQISRVCEPVLSKATASIQQCGPNVWMSKAKEWESSAQALPVYRSYKKLDPSWSI